MANIEIGDPTSARPGRYQFTIRSMLLLTTGVGLACSFVFALPDWAASFTMLGVFLVVPGPLASLAIFGTSNHRAFAIGTLVPWTLFWLVLLIEEFRTFTLDSEGRGLFLFGWLICFAGGYLSLLTRRWITKSSRAAGTETASPNRTSASSRLDG